MRVVAIIQARMGSTRLPGKSMMPLAGKPLVQNVIERVQRAKRLDEVVLAIPQEEGAGRLRDVSDIAFVQCFIVAGDNNDLVSRYRLVAEGAHADIIVRVCADNPCIGPEYIDRAIERYMAWPNAFYSNTTDYVGSTAIDGIGAEVLSISRLKWLDLKTTGRPELREHPHKYFMLDIPEADIRLDINTQADYDFIKGIYDHFGNNTFHVSQVVEYLHGLPR